MVFMAALVDEHSWHRSIVVGLSCPDISQKAQQQGPPCQISILYLSASQTGMCSGVSSKMLRPENTDLSPVGQVWPPDGLLVVLNCL